MKKHHLLRDEMDQHVRIFSFTREGVDLAFAARQSPYFMTWEIMTVKEDDPTYSIDQQERSERAVLKELGVSIEGIHVQDGSPGFRRGGPLAVANVRGNAAPRPNVPRDKLEIGPELDALFERIYSAYGEHLSAEIGALETDRGFSRTWAAQEAVFLAAPLDVGVPENPPSLYKSLRKVPCLLVEENGSRERRNVDEVMESPYFWTIGSQLIASAEYLLREIPGNASIAKLVASFGATDMLVPPDVMLCNDGLEFSRYGLFADREPGTIKLAKARRRVDIQWVRKGDPAHWHRIEFYKHLRNLRLRLDLRYNLADSAHRTLYRLILLIEERPVKVENWGAETIIRLGDFLLIRQSCPPASSLRVLTSKLSKTELSEGGVDDALVLMFIGLFVQRYRPDPDVVRDVIEEMGRNYRTEADRAVAEAGAELLSVLTDTEIFNPKAWARAVGESSKA